MRNGLFEVHPLRHVTLLVVVSIALAGFNGCISSESSKKSSRKSLSEMITGVDNNDWRAEDDEWDYVGEIGRGDRPSERDPDRWYKRFFQSGKANAIERNLGVE